MRPLRCVTLAIAATLASFTSGTIGSVPAGAEMVLNRGNQAEPSSLDPQKGTDAQSARICYDLFEGLLTVGPDGKPVPGVAQKWDVSADGITYTFTLREDAKWSDGTDVTADDFVFSWRRLVDPKTASDYAYFLWPVKNGEAISNGKLAPDSLGVVAVNPHLLKVTLEQPTGYFTASLVHRVTYPVSRANVEKFGADFVKPGNLVSNGAYKLANYVPQAFVKVIRNSFFHNAKTVKVDTVIFHHSDSPETELRRFRAGELDTIQMAPITQVDWLRQNQPEVMKFYPVLGTRYLVVNMTREPLASDVRLRQALSLAVDRDILVSKITKSGDIPAYSLTAPGIAGYPPPDANMAGASQAERDAVAKKLMSEAGYGPGAKSLNVEILYHTDESIRKIVVAVASMWQAKLGVKVTLNNQEWKVLLQNAGEKSYSGMAVLGWVADYPDPYTFLKLFLSNVGRMNRAGYVSKTFDTGLAAANHITDADRRLAMMSQVEAQMLADAPVIPLFHSSYRNLVQTNVKGWLGNPIGIQPSRYIEVTDR